MQEEIIVENGIKSILQKIFDYYYSYKRTCKTVALGGLIGVATAKKDGLMPMEQFFDRDVNPIEDYNTFTWNGIRKTTKSTSNSPFESGDGQNAVIFIGTNDVQKIGFQATYSGQLIKIRLYWVGSWGKWQTFSLT